MINRELTSDEFDELDNIVNKYFSNAADYVAHRFKNVLDVIEVLELSEDDKSRLLWSIGNAVEEIAHVLDSHNNSDCIHGVMEWIEK